MNKFLSVCVAATFATVSFSSFAASHGGAMKDDKKMEECKKMDAKADEKMHTKADKKMKAECKAMMEKK